MCKQDGLHKIFGIAAGGTVGTVVLAVCVCKCCKSYTGCICHEYQNFRKKFDNVDRETMSVEEYVSKRDNVIDSLKRSEKQGNYYFMQQEIQHYVHIKKVIILKKEKPLLTNIFLRGEDHFGVWTAQGSIMSKNNEIFMWYYKEYQNKQIVGQIEKLQHLIHHSLQVKNNNSLEGKWFFKNYDGESAYSGSWRLELNENICTKEQTCQKIQLQEILQ